MDKRFQACIAAFIVVVALVFVVPSINALSQTSANTITINAATSTYTKQAITGGFVYTGVTTNSLYTETFTIASTTLNGVNETQISVNIIGNGFTMSEKGSKSESATGSADYDLLSYVNQTGSYSIETGATTSNGITSGYLTQNMYGPIGKYSFTLTPVSGGESYKALVTLPNGVTVDPSFYQYVNSWHGPWWAPYNLMGWILSWGEWESMSIGLVLAILGVILVTLATAGIALAVIGVVFAVATLYTASDQVVYSYYDTIFLYGVIPMYGEAGFHTDRFYTISLGQWYYIPVYPSTAPWHTGVWPYGF
jgi:hypothetical protein